MSRRKTTKLKAELRTGDLFAFDKQDNATISLKVPTLEEALAKLPDRPVLESKVIDEPAKEKTYNADSDNEDLLLDYDPNQLTMNEVLRWYEALLGGHTVVDSLGNSFTLKKDNDNNSSGE